MRESGFARLHDYMRPQVNGFHRFPDNLLSSTSGPNRDMAGQETTDPPTPEASPGEQSLAAKGLVLTRSGMRDLLGGLAGTGVVLPQSMALGVALFARIKLAPRILPAVPGTISGIVMGVGIFHLVLLAAPGPVPESWGQWILWPRRGNAKRD